MKRNLTNVFREDESESLHFVISYQRSLCFPSTGNKAQHAASQHHSITASQHPPHHYSRRCPSSEDIHLIVSSHGIYTWILLTWFIKASNTFNALKRNSNPTCGQFGTTLPDIYVLLKPLINNTSAYLPTYLPVHQLTTRGSLMAHV